MVKIINILDFIVHINAPKRRAIKIFDSSKIMDRCQLNKYL